MEQSLSQARLDVAFPFEGDEGVRDALRNLMAALEARFQAVEVLQDDAATQADALVNVGLARINDVLLPSVLRIQKLTSLGFLIARSTTSVKLELVQKTFILTEGEQRDLFTPSAYVSIERDSDYTTRAVAKVLSYDAKLGFLTVLPLAVFGAAGPFQDWTISATPGVSEATRSNLDQAGAAMAAAQAARVKADADAAATAGDRAQTTADRIQTALDRAAAATSANNAKGSADAAAASAASSDSQNRVPLDGSQSMTSALTVGTGNNGRIRVVQGDSTHTGYIDFQQKDDARVAYIGYSTSGRIDYWANVPHYFFGSVQTQDMGDLKTYVDKGVRTDVAQPFSRTAMRQARKNIGAGPLYSNQFSTNATLDASYLNSTIWLSGSDYTITLPAAGVAVSGDSLEFVNYGTGTITLACQAGTGLYYNGAASVGNITIGPGQTACMTTDGTSWIVGSRALPPERSINPDAANNFTDAQKQQLYANADIAIPVGQCRLNYISPTSIRLDPFNGNKIFINGNYRTIPAAGVTLSNAGLSANTLYYIYATPTLNIIASINAPKRDPFYGHQVANSGANDATNRLYTLVGAVVTGDSKEFVDSSQFRFVASHFNRSRKHIDLQVSQGGASGSTVMANLGNEAYVFCWGDEAVEFTGVGSCSNGGNQQTMSLQCYLDGLVCGQDATAHNSSPGTFVALTCATSKQPSIGLHRLSIYGKCSGGTSTYYVCMNGTVVL